MKAVLAVALFCVAALSLQGCSCDEAEVERLKKECGGEISGSDCDAVKKALDCQKSSPCWTTAAGNIEGAACTRGTKMGDKDECDVSAKDRCEVVKGIMVLAGCGKVSC
eukprot:gb/GFBE01010315.1/.p1 GENE.gb/GFBE01010315.1/~~gb/GFBE01010315.1/.p1  ORF type:complete len:109 (+),score=19.50 gb/GFBE01010315.1/:1-327(+)